MTKCLLKALKAVDLDQYLELFRSLGYESAGALANFRAEHFEKLNLTEQELLRLIALLDVLKESTREGKICPHYFTATKPTTQQSTTKSILIQAAWSDETIQQRNTASSAKKQSNETLKPKRPTSSAEVTRRSLPASMATMKITKSQTNETSIQRPSTVQSRHHNTASIKSNNFRNSGPKSFLNRPAIQHVKVKSYNYGIPNNKRARNTPYRGNHHGSIFVSSSHHGNDPASYAKPAEIYVYARKRPLLPVEANFQDTINVPDTKRVIIAENKANLDCTPLIKKTEFEFDRVFGASASNREVFESTVLPLMTTNHRHNLTYICFGQTGSGKSHTIFGSKNTDGLLIYCTQLLLKETNFENQLVCSFYEIYNNQVYDLFNDGKRLFVREDGEHRVNVIGVTEAALKDLDSLRCLIDEGLTRRHHGKSAFNSNSSRSHAVFQIALKSDYDSLEDFRLIFIDLAGSERATDAQNNQRQTRREGAQINWSLLALKECIRSMDMTHSHAPFRQSKLTHILRDSLTGSKTRTCLMANVSPPDDCCQCSLNTLQYASRILDISMRHRHRTLQMDYFDETFRKQDSAREKIQRSFKPATASTPVHRTVLSTDQTLFLPTDPAGSDVHKTKPIDIDWQIADNDIPISGSGDNLRLTSHTLSARDCITNATAHSHTQNNKQYLTRYQQTKIKELDEDLSSYFPHPQSNIKTLSPMKTNDTKRSSYDSARLMFDDGNERQWKATLSSKSSHQSKPSFEQSSAAGTFRATPVQITNDDSYKSIADIENVRNKLTATNMDQQSRRSSSQIGLTDSMKLGNYHELDTIVNDIKQTLCPDKKPSSRDETDLLTNRDELLSLVSSRLSTGNRRASSVVTSKTNRSKSKDDLLNPSHASKSRNLPSSVNKTNQKQNRLIKSASSTSSIANSKQEKKTSVNEKKPTVKSLMNYDKFQPTNRTTSHRHDPQQQRQSGYRAAPLRGYHSSDSEANERTSHSGHRRKTCTSITTSDTLRNESVQKPSRIRHVRDEQDQTNAYFLPDKNVVSKPVGHSPVIFAPSTSPTPATYLSTVIMPSSLVQAPLNQLKPVFHQSLEQSMSPLSPVNINNLWPTSASYSSPSKEFGARVSDQLNALRSLLETRLIDQDETRQQRKDMSTAQLSLDAYPKEYLESFRQSPLRNQARDTLDNVNGFKALENATNHYDPTKTDKLRQYEGDIFSTATTASSNQHGYSSLYSHHYEPIIQPSLSSLSNELNQAKVSSTTTPSSTSTITSNLAAKIDIHEARNLSSQGDDNHSQQLMSSNGQVAHVSKGVGANFSNPTSDSERTSQVNSTLQNPFGVTSSGGSSSNDSLSRSPVFISPLNTLEMINGTNHCHDHFLDSGKGSSFLTGSSFDALLNSLKNMREKDFGFTVPSSDDKLIPVVD